MPHEGDNAVLKAARAAVLLADHDFGGCPSGLGRPTLNVGRLEGGLNLNSVPDSAVLGIDIRPVPGQSSERSWPSCAPAARGRGRAAGRLPAFVERRRGRLAGPGRRAHRRASPAARLPTPVPFATDAGFLTPAYGGPPTVVLGPGATEQAHKTDEWCSLTPIEQAAELYADLAGAWCR